MTALIVLVNVALVAIGPGWLVLEVAGWPRSRCERALMSPALSLATVATCGAIAGGFGTALDESTIIAIDVVLLAAWIASHRWRRETVLEPIPWRVAWIAVVPGGVLLAVTIVQVGGLGLPPSDDSLVHASLVRWFMDGHGAPPLLVDRLAQQAAPEIRFGWHIYAAALAHGADLNAGQAVTLGTWPMVFAVPLSLMALVRRIGFAWTLCIATGFASIGFGLVPFRVLALGQEPLLAGGYVLAPVAAVLLWDAFGERAVAPAVLAVVALAGVVYVHPSDLPTVAVLFAMLLVARLSKPRRPSMREGVTLVAGVIASGALLLPENGYRATTLPGSVLGTSTGSSPDSTRLLTANHLADLPSVLFTNAVELTHDFVLPVLVLAAVVLTWRNRMTIALLLYIAGLAVLEVDAWRWQLPRTMFTHLVPWVDPERILYSAWFSVVPLAALGAGTLVDRLLAARPVRDRTGVLVLGVAIAALPSLTLAPSLLGYAETHIVGATSADVTALVGIDTAVPAGDIILTDGVADGGAWIGILTNRDTLLHKDWEANSAAPPVMQALRDLCSPSVAGELRSLHVRWVYVGAQTDQDGGFADRRCPSGNTALTPVPLPGTRLGSYPVLFEVRPG